MTKITQETLLPLGLVAAILYAVFIVGSYSSRVAATESNVADLQKAVLDNSAEHRIISAQLGRIEGLLEEQYKSRRAGNTGKK